MSAPSTEVRENARLELLRNLAWYRDWCAKRAKEEPDEPLFRNGFAPLFCSEWENRREDIALAAKECDALGEIEMVRPDGTDKTFDVLVSLEGAPVKITDKGYDWIRARDAIGEAEQERRDD